MTVIDKLKELGYTTIPEEFYTYVSLWKSWYVGKVKGFHQYRRYNGHKWTKCNRASLGMAKKVCEDWANLLMNEKVEITLEGKPVHFGSPLEARAYGIECVYQTLAMSPALQRYPGYAPQWSLAFRRGMGANAFALPGGTVVLTDEIVQVAERQGLGDEALVGVLAHEIGHVAYRHTTRMLVQQGVLQMGLELALGDVSGLLSSGSALLTAMSYSRAHEREADCFALGLMHRVALPTAPMGDLLLAMVQDARSGGKAPQSGKATEPGQDEAHPIWSLLSSHPDTAERARALRAGQAPGCS